ncbi:BA14K family protein [Tianweitania sp. BSSL-BM11]|uniref:Lectin-like protein BA14k n=1 Tax=Tianweitania aestuarii TaxID=2814886 RepID=A0ABS5RXL5_9HYPH|nr:BA14K family protein [Tianweitania aestuarii]MBS9721052.1 BA14K family protein [Tianweitania aestuarii]
MKRFLKSFVLSAAVAATTLSTIPLAQAHDNWRYRDGYRHHRHDGRDAAVAGIAGLAVGALAGAALAQPRQRIIVDDGYYAPPPPRRVYVQPRYEQPRYVQSRPQVVYSGGYNIEPWSRDWYRYCSDRYRSFNPSTGTFVGYDGVTRFCEAN